jgi:hypothetical protein
MGKYFYVLIFLIVLSGCQNGTNNNNIPSLSEIKLPDNVAIYMHPEGMIIKRIYVDIEVRDFGSAFNSVTNIIKRSNGYLTNTEMKKNPEDGKSGSLSALVPIDKMDTVLLKIRREVGDIKTETASTENVTAGYIDEGARLNNNRKAEEQYQNLLKKARTVDEILKIQQALTEVRMAIESAEKKMKYYETQTSMSTLRINLYEPSTERTTKGTGFISTIRNSFSRGLNGITIVIGAIIIFFISAIPKLPIAYVLYKWGKKKYNNHKGKKPD